MYRSQASGSHRYGVGYRCCACCHWYPAQALPLSQWEPYVTLGTKSVKSLEIPPRAAFFEVYPLSGASKPVFYGKVTHQWVLFREITEKYAKNSLAADKIEVHFGIDSMGLCAPGVMVRSSGIVDLDRAVLRWVSGVEWARQLPPGCYRLLVGP